MENGKGAGIGHGASAGIPAEGTTAWKPRAAAQKAAGSGSQPSSRGRWIAIAALFISIIALSGCAGVGTSYQTWKNNWDWIALGGIAIAAMGCLLALAYMVSSFTGDEQMKAWTKREVSQLVLSAIILAAIFALSLTVDGWLKIMASASPLPAWQDYVNKDVCCDISQQPTCALTPDYAKGRPCHIALALDYLQILLESGRKMANSDLENYYWPALLSQTGISVSAPGMMDIFSLSFKLFAARSIDATFYSLLFDLTFKTMLFIRVQQIFLDMMWGAIVPMMLGIGIGLRAFHFSRKTGGMLIALGLSVYIVMPMFYVLMGGILFGFMSGWTQADGTHSAFGNTFDVSQLPISNPPSWFDMSGSPKKQSEVLGKQMSMGDPTGNATPDQKQDEGDLVTFLWSVVKVFWNATWGTLYNVVAGTPAAAGTSETAARFAVDGPISNLAMLMVFTVVTPFLALMTMLASFKHFSPLIGGDVELQLLSRLI